MTGSVRTYAMQTCPVCRGEFQPRSNRVVYCSRACMDKANHSRYYRRGETAAIVPSETKPSRTQPMTEDEFDWWIGHFRRKLDDDAYHPGDLHWRRAEIQRMVNDEENTKTIGEMARYFRVTPKQIRELVQAGKRAKEDAA